MGRRKHRKAERRQRRGDDSYVIADPGAAFAPAPSLYANDDDDDDWGMGMISRMSAPAKACGSCREFIEDQEGGRGTCLHPGSGILSPWTDTAPCAFWTRR